MSKLPRRKKLKSELEIKSYLTHVPLTSTGSEVNDSKIFMNSNDNEYKCYKTIIYLGGQE